MMSLKPRTKTPVRERSLSKETVTRAWLLTLHQKPNQNLEKQKKLTHYDNTYSNEAKAKSQVILFIDRLSKLPEEAVLQAQKNAQ